MHGASRRELFERLDRPALRPLPQASFVYAEWKQVRVNMDYHVELHRHFYSKWHDYVGDPTVADAISDRILHNAHRIVLKVAPGFHAPRGTPSSEAARCARSRGAVGLEEVLDLPLDAAG
jgi:hypothetical protein